MFYVLNIIERAENEGESVKEYIKMKWVLWNEVRRILVLLYIRLYFILNGVRWGTGWRIFGIPVIQKFKNSKISFGSGLILRSWVTSNPVAPYHPVFFSTRTETAVIRIGDGCGMTGGSIIAAERIDIGNRVLIGGNCVITDTDFHPIDKIARFQDPKNSTSKPVVIADDVFIGTQSIVLKGSEIGAGSIIGAGSVVSGKIPPGVVAAGNPAVVIRKLDQ